MENKDKIIKRFEKIIDGFIGYVWENENNTPLDDVEEIFKHIGLNKKELKYFGITDEIKYLREE